MSEPSPYQLRTGLRSQTVVGALLLLALLIGAVAGFRRDDAGQVAATTGTPSFLGDEALVPGDSGTGTVAAGTAPGGAAAGSAAGVTGVADGSSGSPAATGSTGASSGSADGATGDPGAPGSAAAESRTASDVGITEDGVKIGLMNLNCEACAALFPSTGGETSGDNYVETMQHFVDDINERGGINGRKVELVSADYDPVADALQGGGTFRAACLELTERHKVFAVVLGGYGGAGSGNACIFDEHKTPLIHASADVEDPAGWNAVEGRVWGIYPSQARVLLDWAARLAEAKLITPTTKWGLVYPDDGAPSVSRYFTPEMQRRGLKPTHVGVFPRNPDTGATKVQQDIAAMKQKGVTHLVFAGDFGGGQGWASQAAAVDFRPQWLIGDAGQLADRQAGTGFETQGGDIRGAIAFSTAADLTPAQLRPPMQKPCLDGYKRVTGRDAFDADLNQISLMCTLMGVFERAMVRAGVNPTRQSLVQSLSTLGAFPAPAEYNAEGSFGGPYAFGPVKFTALQFGQRKVWQRPCPTPGTPDPQLGCWVHEGPIYQMKY